MRVFVICFVVGFNVVLEGLWGFIIGFEKFILCFVVVVEVGFGDNGGWFGLEFGIVIFGMWIFIVSVWKGLGIIRIVFNRSFIFL